MPERRRMPRAAKVPRNGLGMSGGACEAARMQLVDDGRAAGAGAERRGCSGAVTRLGMKGALSVALSNQAGGWRRAGDGARPGVEQQLRRLKRSARGPCARRPARAFREPGGSRGTRRRCGRQAQRVRAPPSKGRDRPPPRRGRQCDAGTARARWTPSGEAAPSFAMPRGEPLTGRHSARRTGPRNRWPCRAHCMPPQPGRPARRAPGAARRRGHGRAGRHLHPVPQPGDRAWLATITVSARPRCAPTGGAP